MRRMYPGRIDRDTNPTRQRGERLGTVTLSVVSCQWSVVDSLFSPLSLVCCPLSLRGFQRPASNDQALLELTNDTGLRTVNKQLTTDHGHVKTDHGQLTTDN